MSKLTDEQIEDLYFDEFSISKLKEFARAIEAAATEPLLQRIEELERQLEEARKDAERYRWLRDVASGDVWGRIGNVYAPDETDEAIDEAMQKGQS